MPSEYVWTCNPAKRLKKIMIIYVCTCVVATCYTMNMYLQGAWSRLINNWCIFLNLIFHLFYTVLCHPSLNYTSIMVSGNKAEPRAKPMTFSRWLENLPMATMVVTSSTFIAQRGVLTALATETPTKTASIFYEILPII